MDSLTDPDFLKFLAHQVVACFILGMLLPIAWPSQFGFVKKAKQKAKQQNSRTATSARAGPAVRGRALGGTPQPTAAGAQCKVCLKVLATFCRDRPVDAALP